MVSSITVRIVPSLGAGRGIIGWRVGSGVCNFGKRASLQWCQNLISKTDKFFSFLVYYFCMTLPVFMKKIFIYQPSICQWFSKAGYAYAAGVSKVEGLVILLIHRQSCLQIKLILCKKS
jgi:hypothetical protein